MNMTNDEQEQLTKDSEIINKSRSSNLKMKKGKKRY